MWSVAFPTRLRRWLPWPQVSDQEGARRHTSDTQPVFSPDGTHIEYTQPVVRDWNQVINYESNTFGAPLRGRTFGRQRGRLEVHGPGPQGPEVADPLPLPGAALIVGGGYPLIRRRQFVPYSGKAGPRTILPPPRSVTPPEIIGHMW
jgi:hypothetical protein